MPLAFPPSCFTRADGTNGIGTPVNPGNVGINYAAGNPNFIFEEYSDSPEIESGEQSTIVHRFYADPNTAQTVLLTNPRGTVLIDNAGFASRVLSVKINPHSKAGAKVYDITMICEAQSFGTPPDEFNVEVVEVNPAAEKHPRYSGLTYNDRYIVRNADIVDNLDLGQQYKNIINTIPTANNEQAAALELLYKKHKGEDSFYLAGYKVVWSTYYWLPTLINPGGYIEDPIVQGGLPAAFWSTTGLPGGTNIFGQTFNYNPNLYPFSDSADAPYNVSWLRQCDQLTLQRTWFKLTRSWIGSPLGQWDLEWYSRIVQPYQTSENQGIIN